MSNLSAFLAGNAEIRTNKKVVVSDRFKENGKPVEWEIRSITANEDEILRKDCTRSMQVTGKKNQFRQQLDGDKYLAKLCAKAVVFPNLNDAELCKSYGANSAEELIKTMLYKDEFEFLCNYVVGITDSEDMDELVEEAKN